LVKSNLLYLVCEVTLSIMNLNQPTKIVLFHYDVLITICCYIIQLYHTIKLFFFTFSYTFVIYSNSHYLRQNVWLERKYYNFILKHLNKDLYSFDTYLLVITTMHSCNWKYGKWKKLYCNNFWGAKCKDWTFKQIRN
jgi:hypothetical protein